MLERLTSCRSVCDQLLMGNPWFNRRSAADHTNNCRRIFTVICGRSLVYLSDYSKYVPVMATETIPCKTIALNRVKRVI